MDASVIFELKVMVEQNRCFQKMNAEIRMKNDLLKEAHRKNALRSSHRRRLAMNADM